MSKYSKDKLQEIDATISRHIATHPHISARKIAEWMKLDHHFVLKRKNKLDRQRAEEIKRITLDQDLGDISNFITAIIPTISAIIFNKDAQDRDKIGAAKLLIDGKIKMLGTKFDAGIYERQLGKIKSDTTIGEEERELITQALNYAFNSDKPTKDTRIG